MYVYVVSEATTSSLRGCKISWGSMPPDPLVWVCYHIHVLDFPPQRKVNALIYMNRVQVHAYATSYPEEYNVM